MHSEQFWKATVSSINTKLQFYKTIKVNRNFVVLISMVMTV